MGKRLTDKERKKIKADYVESRNKRATARKNGVSYQTVDNIVKADPALMQKLAQKENENTADVLAYMATQTQTKKQLLSKLLEAMEKKAENIDMFTNIKDLATAYGIILDKEYKPLELEHREREVAIKESQHKAEMSDRENTEAVVKDVRSVLVTVRKAAEENAD